MSSCSFFSKHPEIVKDAEAFMEDIADAGCPDLKQE
jgi:hypothetical protein